MRQQQGSALIFSLVILLVMTLVGITAMSTSTLEEKMAANDRAQQAAFQNAETGMISAEAMLNTRSYNDLEADFKNQTQGYYDIDTEMFDIYDPQQWAGNCIQDNDIAGIGIANPPPCYIVKVVAIIYPEDITEPGAITKVITQVTSRGTDATNTASVLLQTYNEKQIISQ